MTLHRFFATGPVPSDGGVLPLSEADIHHLRDVVRLAAGDEIVLVAEGVAIRVRLDQVGEWVTGQAVGRIELARAPRVTLVQGLAKGDKMDDVVRHVTELGVWRVIPLAADRSVVRLDAARAAARVSRWERIATEAAKQSQRADVPLISPVSAVGDLRAMLADSRVLVAWEDAGDAPGIAAALAAVPLPEDADVAVVIGPEGGLTSGEVAFLVDAGATMVSLGPTILRTETAGIVATALAIHARGGLGASCE